MIKLKLASAPEMFDRRARNVIQASKKSSTCTFPTLSIVQINVLFIGFALNVLYI